ncbi:NADase-type glycan-binding domain-containing protein [Aliiruegeria sabulilitoris]|uniref:NADase-type glycan-binding domain-containing protein n=1 Tax=Aliiruegeria sabulilitoris TaxID=1510458 RepID=UPI00082AC698|nr:hypothetical protein [Aliiruegeria sabulilitoris]NDR56557.1 hypothetical protein [Pseudoruegeria sp. M32A2M]
MQGAKPTSRSPFRFAGLLASFLMSAGTASAWDVCANFGATELVGGMTYCVASVLPSSNVASYGPDNLFDGIGQTAWCEGSPGQGVGQRIVIYIHNGAPFRQLLIRIGYGKSGQTYGRNSRPSLVRITTDRGTTHDVNLPDYHGELALPMPALATYSSVTLEILAVYPGSNYQDTCISEFYPDFEYQ